MDTAASRPLATLVGAERAVPCLDGSERRAVDLDQAASTQAHPAVVERVTDFLPWYSSVHRGAGYRSRRSTAAYEEARRAILAFTGRDPDGADIAIVCRNTTEALNHLAYRLRLAPTDVVVTTVVEHHANLLPWGRVATRRYVDGMILEASAIHTAYPEYLRTSLQHRILSNNSPFESEIFEVAKGERQEILDKGPAIILASSGMLNGGASLEYFKALAEDQRNLVTFVGYNSVSSLGRRLQNGLTEVALPGEDGKMRSEKVNLQVKTVEGFSGHSDRRELMRFVENLRPFARKIYTMHGEESKCEDLARTIGNKMRIEGRAPMDLDSMRLK